MNKFPTSRLNRPLSRIPHFLRFLTLLAVCGWAATAAAQSEQNIQLSANFTVDETGGGGKLQITALIDPGFHIFTQEEKESIPTQFVIPGGQGVRIAGAFDASADPHVDFATGQSYYEGIVIFVAPLEFDAAVKPDNLQIEVQVTGQICEAERCNRFSKEVFAVYAAPKPPPDVVDVGDVAPPKVAVSGFVAPLGVRPGESVVIQVELAAAPDRTLPPPPQAESMDGQSQPLPTLLVLSKSNGWKSTQPKLLTTDDGKQVYSIEISVPKNTEPRSYSLGGLVAVQTTRESVADDVTTAAFSVDISVGDQQVDGQKMLVIETTPQTYEQINQLRIDRLEAEKKSAGRFANYSIVTVMGLAFLAGLILNVMPCVLPVIGLKVMSFAQQAGEKPLRVFLLNYVFAMGMLTVFLLLATLAVFANYGWGDLFTDARFQLIMIAVVFVFGLSFLGVWEIPLPGMIGIGAAGKMAEREGFGGAFFKGILTTLLATPCSGPLLAPTLAWAFVQPPSLTYLTFVAMGIGMAFPYLLVGIFPQMVGILPRPGQWMVTFKHVMGFAMMGAAIFLVGGLGDKYVVPALSMSLGLAVACWWIGRVSLAAEIGEKLRAWGQGIALAAAGCFVAFFVLIPQHELEWSPYSKVRVEDELANGNIVLVDFTADW